MPYGINDRGVNPGEVNLVRDMDVLIDVSDLVEVKWIAVFKTLLHTDATQLVIFETLPHSLSYT